MKNKKNKSTKKKSSKKATTKPNSIIEVTSEITYGKLEQLELILEALIQNFGNVLVSSKKIGVSTQTIYNYKNNYPEVSEAIKQGRRMIGDEIENKFLETAKEGDVACMIFYLKTQKGYREVKQVESTNVNLNVVQKDPEEAQNTLLAWQTARQEESTKTKDNQS